ncbi:unnamed protein product, partial [Ectocarpus sp. 12 AP-2014]
PPATGSHRFLPPIVPPPQQPPRPTSPRQRWPSAHLPPPRLLLPLLPSRSCSPPLAPVSPPPPPPPPPPATRQRPFFSPLRLVPTRLPTTLTESRPPAPGRSPRR